MKAMKVVIVLMMVGLLSGDLVAAGFGKRKTQGQSVEATKRVQPSARTQAGVTKTAAARGKQAAATPARKRTAGRTQQPVKAPVEIDTLVWDSLSQEDQSLFNQLNTNFKKTIASFAKSKNYRLWRDTIIGQAKAILDINILLVDYCIEVITDELEKNAEEKGIDAEQQVAEITQELKTYIPEYVLVEGTEKEQFSKLMDYIPFDRSGKPTAQWLSNVLQRGINLVSAQVMSLQEMRQLLTKGFSKKRGMPITKGSSDEKTIANIVNVINDRVNKIKQESSPEYVNQNYQNLMLTLGDAASWDMRNNMPSEEWRKKIVAASKGMKNVLGMKLDDLEQQIGAQVFFVATMKNGGQALRAQKENDLVTLVTALKNQIGHE